MREAHVAEVLSDVPCLWGPFDLPRSRRQCLAFFVRILLQSFAHFCTRPDSNKMTKLVEFTTSVIRLIQKDLVASNLVKVVHQQLWKLLVIFIYAKNTWIKCKAENIQKHPETKITVYFTLTGAARAQQKHMQSSRAHHKKNIDHHGPVAFLFQFLNDIISMNLRASINSIIFQTNSVQCVEPTLGTQPACVGHGQAAQIVESSVRKDPEGAVNAHRRITFRGRSLFIYPCFSLSLVAATNVGGPTNTCAYPCPSEMCSFSWTADLEWHVLPSHL